MQTLLEADVVHRGRTIARSGMTGMFADLSPRIRLVIRNIALGHASPRRIRMSQPASHYNQNVSR